MTRGAPLQPADAYIDQAARLGVGGVLAPMRAADPSPLGIAAVLIGEFPLQHEDLLAAPMGVVLKPGAASPAHQRHVLRVTALGIDRKSPVSVITDSSSPGP